MIEIRRPWAIYVITKHGIEIGKTLMAQLPGADVFVSEKLMAQAPIYAQPMALPMGPVLAKNFKAYDAHIFIISVGAVVRMVAPLFENKKVDPAIICIDDKAQFVIPVLSGHVGRGNEFTHRIAKILGSVPVVTTASDVQGTLTVDILGRELGWVLDDLDRNVTVGCAAVVNQQPVLIVQETGESNFWPLDKPLPLGVTYTQTLDNVAAQDYEIILVVSDRDIQTTHPAIFAKAVIYRPKSLVLGLGCDSNTPLELIERGIHKVLKENGLDLRSVKAIATVDKKAEEPAFLALKEKYGWGMRVYTADELNTLTDLPNPSQIVQKFIGAKGVSEPSALLASGSKELIVTKQIYKEADIPRSMTIAVARLPFEGRLPQAQLAG